MCQRYTPDAVGGECFSGALRRLRGCTVHRIELRTGHCRTKIEHGARAAEHLGAALSLSPPCRLVRLRAHRSESVTKGRRRPFLHSCPVTSGPPDRHVDCATPDPTLRNERSSAIPSVRVTRPPVDFKITAASLAVNPWAAQRSKERTTHADGRDSS